MALRLYDFYPKKCHPFQPQVTPKDQSLPGLLPQLAASAAASVASVASAAGGASCSGPGSTTSMGGWAWHLRISEIKNWWSMVIFISPISSHGIRSVLSTVSLEYLWMLISDLWMICQLDSTIFICMIFRCLDDLALLISSNGMYDLWQGIQRAWRKLR